MRRVQPLGVEALEARELLAKAHPGVVRHAPPPVAVVPLVLDGTLTVNNKGTASTMNDDGSTTTSAPVAGQLGGLGEVRGFWVENDDEFGDATGPDTLSLHNAKGSFVVAFANVNPAPAHSAARGPLVFTHTQRVEDGRGAYAHAAETGSIALTTNKAGTTVETLTLASGTP